MNIRKLLGFAATVRLGRTGKALAAGALATAAFGVAAAPANAYVGDSAFNGRFNIYLSPNPVEHGGSACAFRQIWLIGDDYEWFPSWKKPNEVMAGAGIYDQHAFGDYGTREITLNSGQYDWMDCITQHAGYYRMTSTLQLSDRSLPLAYLEYDVEARYMAGNFNEGTVLQH